ncbi:MAG: DUF1924 domain-containing protein [Gammaproteobacteria bacterium]|nr:DUF1924 domain-containing protein [Gammaproteobacteria bacterium]
MNRFTSAHAVFGMLAATLAPVFAGAADPLPAIQVSAQAEGRFTGFSAERGAVFFRTRGSDWSCTTCHMPDPRQPGRHTVTGKAIQPMAPAVNPQRLTDEAKVEKWFKRNCRDTMDRECTSLEKGDVITYLRSLGR